MRSVKVEQLNFKRFYPFGTYYNFIDPDTEKIGDRPLEFYRDIIQLYLGNSVASFSTCRVEPREYIIDASEFHSHTGEGILPIDSDILIHVGPAVSGDVPPVDKIRVFFVPKGTLVVLKPGVWHHGPFTVNDKPANVLIILPERTYANDCRVVELDECQKIRIEVTV